jgi:hypothetical protein
MFVEAIEKLAALHAKHFCRLTLRKATFLKPLEHGCSEHVAPNMVGIFSQDPKRVIRKFNCHRLHVSNFTRVPLVLQSKPPLDPRTTRAPLQLKGSIQRFG